MNRVFSSSTLYLLVSPVSPSADSTGTHSLYTTYKDYEIMFHVSTMLPYTPNNKQQVCHLNEPTASTHKYLHSHTFFFIGKENIHLFCQFDSYFHFFSISNLMQHLLSFCSSSYCGSVILGTISLQLCSKNLGRSPSHPKTFAHTSSMCL